jgi:hypothetical protein
MKIKKASSCLPAFFLTNQIAYAEGDDFSKRHDPDDSLRLVRQNEDDHDDERAEGDRRLGEALQLHRTDEKSDAAAVENDVLRTNPEGV